MIDYDKINLHSSVNYMKEAFGGEHTYTLPVNDAAIVFTFNHNLGYKPAYSVASEIIDSTILWSNNRGEVDYMSPLFNRLPRVESWVTNTQLVVRVSNRNTTWTGTRKLNYKIYSDYGA